MTLNQRKKYANVKELKNFMTQCESACNNDPLLKKICVRNRPILTALIPLKVYRMREIGSLGYVNIIGFLLISPVTVWAAPIGAKLAHKLDKRQLGMLFGGFLFVVSCRMLYRTFA